MMDELLEQFVIEGRELVQQAVDGLLALEQAGYAVEPADSAFRAIHTLKGSVGLFDAAPLGAVLHAAEDVIAAARDARQAPSAEATETLLNCCSQIEIWIEAMARTEGLSGDAAARAAVLVAGLRTAMDGALAGPDPTPFRAAATPDWMARLLADDTEGRAQTALRYEPAPGCFFAGDDPLALVRSVPALVAVRIEPRRPWSLADHDPFLCNLVILALSAAPIGRMLDLFRAVRDQVAILPVPVPTIASGPPEDAMATGLAPAMARRTVRVEEDRIDGLANLVSELFVIKNRLAQTIGQVAAMAPDLARDLAANQAAFDRLAGGIHRAVMQIRSLPLDHSLRRLPRVVREVANQLNREVRFTIEGAGTQADKATVDGLFEPLLHVLRNAVDHGVEPPAARLAAGKPAEGRIVLAAALDGEQIVVTVTDDGPGIDAGALRRTAAARGLASAEALAAMDDTAALDLVFLPGVSTAAAVTETSGRGVGMDAVRIALRGMGGQVGVAPAPGGGTVVRLAVPQSAAITTIIVVIAGGEAFGVPIALIRETARIPRAEILPVSGGAACVLRAQTIPLLNLAALLGSAASEDQPEAKVLVVTVAGQTIGLEVDSFGARMDLVVRPLDGLLAGLHGLRGSALLGDGQVLLVLNLPALLT